LTTRVTVSWHGENRFVGVGGSGGPPVLINFASGAGVADANARAPGGPTPAGPKPTELLLIAAAACTGLDIVSLLGKQRVTFTGLEIDVSGERAEDHPRIFTDLKVLYRLKAKPDALPHLERAAALSMNKYCGVSLSLKAAKTWRCEVEPPR